MATFQSYGDGIGYIKGSPMVGNPITIKPKAMTISKTNTDDVIAFHRLIVEVKARLSSDTDYNVITNSTSVGDGEIVEFDISSALRAVADAYVYTPAPTTYPIIEFQVKAYDEYMLNGITKTNQGTCYLPTASTFYGALMGKYSDMERLKATNGLKRAYDFCRKPASSPQIVAVGETMAYTNTFVMPANHAVGFDFADIITYKDSTTTPSHPQSVEYEVLQEGLQQIGDFQIFGIPADDNRYQFRFINGLGVLDSISVYSLRSTEVNITGNEYAMGMAESFDSFQRGIVRKSNDYETWRLTSGPLDRQWQSWFIHEFLMAENVWIYINGVWVRCHIVTDDTVTGYNASDSSMLEVQFSVRLDINGSLDPALAI